MQEMSGGRPHRNGRNEVQDGAAVAACRRLLQDRQPGRAVAGAGDQNFITRKKRPDGERVSPGKSGQLFSPERLSDCSPPGPPALAFCDFRCSRISVTRICAAILSSGLT